MPKSTLTWYKSKSNRLLKDFRLLKQKDIAIAINESQQTVSYRIRKVYPIVLPDLIRILDLAGYEIKEKEEMCK